MFSQKSTNQQSRKVSEDQKEKRILEISLLQKSYS
jgi:hypothetical protein